MSCNPFQLKLSSPCSPEHLSLPPHLLSSYWLSWPTKISSARSASPRRSKRRRVCWNHHLSIFFTMLRWTLRQSAWALRHCQIADRATFAALDDSVEGLKNARAGNGDRPRSPISARSPGSRRLGRRQERRQKSRCRPKRSKRTRRAGSNVARRLDKRDRTIQENAVQNFKTTSCPRSSTTRNFRRGCLRPCSEPKRWIR